jgi:hypothetical protein
VDHVDLVLDVRPLAAHDRRWPTAAGVGFASDSCRSPVATGCVARDSTWRLAASHGSSLQVVGSTESLTSSGLHACDDRGGRRR